ncbi:hypothetical protein OESDEN_17551 [Oesophagostomum dentatum]|uniref:Carbohydrate sulfotransferase n=1 Tax=Oesophagostomum dentatum TaxID=61180 RepID=A0A0B1SCV1_OESDE|nr:hypothetical protein OESDEN_17551 [Oesophagostomum dentatum]
METAPNHRMMTCLIQKSMSTVMSAIFCFLIREKEFVDAGRSILREYSDIRMCEGKNEFKSMNAMLRGLHMRVHDLNRWRFTVVTREPVDRFLSGFIDRCIRRGLHWTSKLLYYQYTAPVSEKYSFSVARQHGCSYDHFLTSIDA